MPVVSVLSQLAAPSAGPIPAGGDGGNAAAENAKKLKPLTEMLGYRSDAALIAELREVLALGATHQAVAPAASPASASTAEPAPRHRRRPAR